MSTLEAPDRTRLRRWAVGLAWATVAWNTVEATVAIVAGSAAGSVALVSFGLDSAIEVASALVIIWQFSGIDEQREQRALRLIAISFFARCSSKSAGRSSSGSRHRRAASTQISLLRSPSRGACSTQIS